MLAVRITGKTQGLLCPVTCPGPTFNAFLLDFTKEIRIVISCPAFFSHRKISQRSFGEDFKIALVHRARLGLGAAAGRGGPDGSWNSCCRLRQISLKRGPHLQSTLCGLYLERWPCRGSRREYIPSWGF